MRSTEDLNRLDYELIMAEHSVEKGLSHFNLRPFGKNPLRRIFNFINLELKYEHPETHFAFSTAINLLKQYMRQRIGLLNIPIKMYLNF